ncbi:hypothetical protein Ciccas_014169, partial [Cichlidogyrus casuarinus]
TLVERRLKAIVAAKDEIKQALRDDIDGQVFATSSDCWTSDARIEVHYIDRNWNLETLRIGAQLIFESHTGQHLHAIQKEILDSYNLQQSQV